MIKLSVVIITFNEEKNIARCLDSVKKVADEIVVLDSFSKDRTKEICLSHGVSFFEHAFDGHIQQKNRAITYANNPYVLSLDADEALDETLEKSILEVKQNWTHDGYYMNRLTNYCGHWVKHCNWYPDRKLRLWDSRKGSWTGINPHDKYELFEGDKNTKHIKGDILHYSYNSLEDHYKQVEYFTNIASKAYFEKGKKAPWFKLVANPVAKFISHYFIHLGFLDGKAGFLISKISAYATWLKYKKIRALYANLPIDKQVQNAETFLISRTDSIGDVILTLPMAGILKKQFPACTVIFLGRNYTKDVIEACSFVDTFVSYDELFKKPESEQINFIRSLHISTCIHVFPKKEVGQLVKKAGVKNRIGTTNRAHHWFTCNKLVKLSRKNSDLHEAQLNLKLLKPLGIDKTFSLEEIEQAYGFKSKAVIPAAIKQLISSDKKNIILHAKSQGSGREWGLENFGRLIELLDPTKYSVFISGTEKEKPLLQPLIDKYPRAIDITGKLTLAEFITFIDSCEALIAASTGPLHIAAGFGKYAIGLFPSVRPMHPGRWAPIGKHAHVVMMKEDCENCKPKSNCVCENNNEAKEVFGILESIRK